jgi:hypothetical protein
LPNPKQIIPKGGIGWWRSRHHSPPILGTNIRRCNGKSTNSPQSKVTDFFL